MHQKTSMSGPRSLEIPHGVLRIFISECAIFRPISTNLTMLRRYINQFEKFHPHPTQPFVDATQRGTSGPISIGYFNTISEKADAFIKSCISVGIPFTPDFNGPKGTLGVSRVSHNPGLCGGKASGTSIPEYYTPVSNIHHSLTKPYF